MALYITRNGQRFGPYSVTDVRAHLRTGNVVLTDLAWQEGMPTWVPLNQILGFGFVAPPAPPAPVATTTPEESHRPRPENKSFIQKIITGVVAGAVVLFKLATPLFVLLKTGGSMLLSIGAYSLIFGWRFAAGLVLLIFVHEMGHFIAAKIYGIPVSAPMFIPFMGAYVLLKGRPMHPWTNGIISYAGPLAGGLGGWACLFLALSLHSNWMIAVALYTFGLNLFNLLPIPPMDGSYIWIAFSKRRTPQLSPEERWYMGAFLAALIAGLILGCLHSWGHLPPPASFK